MAKIFLAPINLRCTGATAADSAVWMMRAGATKTLYIRRIVIFGCFDGTAAASTARWELRRFRTATPSGGTAITAIPKIVGDVTTTADIRQETAGAALTVTSITFDTPMAAGAACPRGSTGAVAVLNVDFSAAPLQIAVNDGLCIRNTVTAVIGDVLAGFIEWEEV